MAERRAGYLQEVEGYYDTLQNRNDKVGQAARLVRERHAEQKRKESGLPYENHLWDCHRILIQELRIEDETMEAAVLLHDVVEDNHVTLDEIRKQFGDDVADLVGRLEKVITPEGQRDDIGSAQKVVSLENGNGREIYNQQEAENIFVKALILKLVDRLSNMRDIPKTDAKERKATETLEIYVELAEALGMWEVKKELEDLAYADLHPDEYRRIKEKIDGDPRRSEEFKRKWAEKLEQLAAINEIDARVEVRKASVRHIKEKHRRKAYKGEAIMGNYRQVNDVTSFRLIVKDVKDIFKIEGIISLDDELARLINNKTIDRYIGVNARPNGYQAYQLTLILPQGEIEIAIVTEEMEEFNRWGVVSKIRRGEKDLEAPKIMFVNGRPRFMREKDARVIDLGCLVYHNFGTREVVVLVDNQEMDLDAVIPHGSIVEFITSDKPSEIGPAQFYDIALPQTKEKMDRQIRIAERNELISVGRDILMSDLENRGVLHMDFVKKHLDKFVELEIYESLDEVMYLIATGALPIDDMSAWFKKNGVIKEELGITSVLVSGKDEPGILEYVSGKVRRLGGNIEMNIIEVVDGHHSMIIMIRGIGLNDEKQLRKILSKGRRFTQVKVV